jgi:hypothetical protein
LIEISVGFSILFAIDCYKPIPLIYSLVGIEQIAVEVLFSTSRTALIAGNNQLFLENTVSLRISFSSS